MGDHELLHILHRGNIIHSAENGALENAQGFYGITRVAARMANRTLTDEERVAFATPV
jgi:hypothetical protein